ncbi:MAG: helix-hairpin-helix domain-containing protein, partial [Candidatus Desulforudis sp.]|nr:helix-hairpin-helix domain-containing protein [Desulforudis sp.]
GVSHTSQTYQRYWAAVQAEDADYQKAAGQSWTFGNCRFDVLGPTHAHKDLNDNSVVARLSCPGGSFIFTGDAEKDGEGAILHKNLDANILKVGHHGSRTSTSNAFLAAVDPEVAVIMVGEGNRYGHPHDETLTKLAGIEIYRTDLHGTVVVSLTDRGYSVSTQRTPAVQPVPAPAPSPDPGGVNINTATVDELQRIVHIGQSRAEEIIRLRPFSSLDDLSRVTGIGPSRLADIKAQGVAYVE